MHALLPLLDFDDLVQNRLTLYARLVTDANQHGGPDTPIGRYRMLQMDGLFANLMHLVRATYGWSEATTLAVVTQATQTVFQRHSALQLQSLAPLPVPPATELIGL